VKPILFIRCDPLETFGTGPGAVAEAGAQVAVWEAIDPGAERPTLTDHAGVVLFGSTFNVEHADEQPFIKDVADLTRESVERAIPFLGLCFGAQVLAWALDADVSKAGAREVGFEPIHVEPAIAEDPVLGHYSDGDLVFHWHMDTFALPDDAALLATGDRVRHQAFRRGDAAWATQFHAEIDGAEADQWVTAATEEEDLERAWGKSPARIRDEVAAHMSAHERRGRETFRRFVEFARNRT
jgi:GMP synthase (glutamine-hydrolysing)